MGSGWASGTDDPGTVKMAQTMAQTVAHAIFPSPRVRRSPYYEATVAAGASAFAPYNHMLLPMGYGDPLAEYERLTTGVSMWDVAVQRQIELNGPDAGPLAQALCPRRLDKMPVGMGWYVPLCDYRGVLLNDPVLMKLAEDRYWLSIADSDVLLWARGVAGARDYQVNVFEADVSPLAVQGPRAEDVVAAMFGDWIREIRYFEFRDVDYDIPLKLARSGYSKQGGFELYLMDGTRGLDLWDRVATAGKEFGIGPGSPNPMERVESGLLSWGGDTDDETNPFEVRLGRFVDLDCPDDVIGIHALRRIKENGPLRWQLGVKLDVEDRLPAMDFRSEITRGSMLMGHVTAHAWSPKLQQNIGLALVSRDLKPGDSVNIALPGGAYSVAQMCKLPFV
ncbi:MAG: glycine cleavage T C-terminal barrel domain-containing protein [Pseudomonadota bacterium]